MMSPFSRIALALCAAGALVGCAGDDGDGPGGVDAAVGQDGGSGDAPMACVLPTATTACTVGNDAPCQALCAAAYCYNFNQLPNPVCTTTCTPGTPGQCPAGWTCNNMGRCRPP
jgi:hypothetical protein